MLGAKKAKKEQYDNNYNKTVRDLKFLNGTDSDLNSYLNNLRTKSAIQQQDNNQFLENKKEIETRKKEQRTEEETEKENSNIKDRWTRAPDNLFD